MIPLRRFENMRPGKAPVPFADKVTRALHSLIPVETQNRWRDNGSIRGLFDGLTTFGFAVLGVLMPHIGARMLALRSRMRSEQYGDSGREILEIYDGPCEEVKLAARAAHMHLFASAGRRSMSR